MEKPAAVELEEGYYLKNFLEVITAVREIYDDLLSESETEFIRSFLMSSISVQRLYVRLITRKGPWFRRDKLIYKDIPNMEDALRDGLAAGFLVESSKITLPEALECLTLPEIKTQICDHFMLPEWGAMKKHFSRLKRSELLEFLLGKETEIFHTALLEHLTLYYRFVAPNHIELLRFFLLLFFGNQSQSLTEFVLQDLGIYQYEKYELSKTTRLFRVRIDAEMRLKARELSETIFSALEAGDMDAALENYQKSVAEFPLTHAAMHRLQKLRLHLGRELERSENLEMALGMYENLNLPPARERRIRILLKLQLEEQALYQLEQMHTHPIDETEKEFVRVMHRKLCRKYSLSFCPAEPVKVPELRLCLEKSDTMRVESCVLQWALENGQKGFFSENHLWLSAFGLFFWDIIFMPVEGAFVHRFQSQPLDMFSSAFSEKRKVPLQKRLSEITSSAYTLADMMRTIEMKSGTTNRFVYWHDELPEHMTLLTRHFSGPLLAATFERMLFDLSENSSGFPDLFLYNETTDSCSLVEVKGPGDTLRPTQKAWLEFFHKRGIDVRVAKVTWQGV